MLTEKTYHIVTPSYLSICATVPIFVLAHPSPLPNFEHFQHILFHLILSYLILLATALKTSCNLVRSISMFMFFFVVPHFSFPHYSLSLLEQYFLHLFYRCLSTYCILVAKTPTARPLISIHYQHMCCACVLSKKQCCTKSREAISCIATLALYACTYLPYIFTIHISLQYHILPLAL